MEEGSDHIYIEKLLNWPNPFTDQTYFHFEHKCDSELEVMVQIFTVSGKLVKTIRQPVSAEPWREGYRTGRFAIPWDGLDDFGDKIGKRSEEHTSELQSRGHLVCRLLLEK